MLHEEYNKLNSLYARKILKAPPRQLAPSTDDSGTIQIEDAFIPGRPDQADRNKSTAFSAVGPESNVRNNLNNNNLTSEPIYGLESQGRLAKV